MSTCTCRCSRCCSSSFTWDGWRWAGGDDASVYVDDDGVDGGDDDDVDGDGVYVDDDDVDGGDDDDNDGVYVDVDDDGDYVVACWYCLHHDWSWLPLGLGS